MLTITRRPGEIVHLFTDAGEHISIVAGRGHGSGHMRMAFSLPESVLVLRDEIYCELHKQGVDMTSAEAIRAGAQALHAGKKAPA